MMPASVLPVSTAPARVVPPSVLRVSARPSSVVPVRVMVPTVAALPTQHGVSAGQGHAGSATQDEHLCVLRAPGVTRALAPDGVHVWRSASPSLQVSQVGSCTRGIHSRFVLLLARWAMRQRFPQCTDQCCGRETLTV
jgi:hypothetical protein